MLETGDFGGDKLGGLEFEVFRAREPVFGGKRANLEAQAAQKTQDTKNALFGVRRFQGAVTKR